MTLAETKTAYRISIKGMAINLLLCLLKGLSGLLIHSVSLLSDAVHSLTDIFSTLVVLLGVKLSSKPADEGHPYGHEKIECVIALFLGLMLFVIGAAVSWQSYIKWREPSAAFAQNQILDVFAAGAAVISIAAKEWMYRFTIKYARQIHSPSMTADAWHHRSDAISSVGSLIGVLGICAGFPLIDVIACFFISIIIFKAAYQICADACKGMIDTAADEPVISEIRENILQNTEVLALDLIKTRQFGSKLYVDVEVTLDHTMSFEQAHHVAHSIEEHLENTIYEIKSCMVHVNPS